MEKFLETTIDKFTFRIATDRLYSSEGLWVKQEAGYLCIGVSDFLQQRSGDIAFVEAPPENTELAIGDELIVIETIKVNISLSSPVTGKIIKVNPNMLSTPELINQDPYDQGWIAVLDGSDWERQKSRLLTPQAYFDKIKQEAEQEINT